MCWGHAPSESNCCLWFQAFDAETVLPLLRLIEFLNCWQFNARLCGLEESLHKFSFLGCATSIIVMLYVFCLIFIIIICFIGCHASVNPMNWNTLIIKLARFEIEWSLHGGVIIVLIAIIISVVYILLGWNESFSCWLLQCPHSFLMVSKLRAEIHLLLWLCSGKVICDSALIQKALQILWLLGLLATIFPFVKIQDLSSSILILVCQVFRAHILLHIIIKLVEIVGHWNLIINTRMHI